MCRTSASVNVTPKMYGSASLTANDTAAEHERRSSYCCSLDRVDNRKDVYGGHERHSVRSKAQLENGEMC